MGGCLGPPEALGKGGILFAGAGTDYYGGEEDDDRGNVMKHGRTEAPRALVTLRAYHPAPARVELVYLPTPGRLLRALLCLGVFWGIIPLLIWVPPHYPWVVGSFFAGIYLCYRQWTGRYRVRAFAGICPRCARPLSLGIDHTIDLPHTLTCYHCHFEPQLEVRFGEPSGEVPRGAAHHSPECVGRWRVRWLADAAFLVCERCLAHAPATPEARRLAEQENERAALLERLASEGRTML